MSPGLADALATILGGLLISLPRPFTCASVFLAFVWAGCHRGIVRMAISVALALPVAFMAQVTAPAVPTYETTPIWIILVFKEALIGLTIGLLLSIPFWAAGIAGSVLSILRFETSDASDLIGETPLTRTMLLIMVCAFVYNDGLYRMVDIFYHTHTLWPVDAVFPVRTSLNIPALKAMLISMFAFSVSVVLPFLILIILIDIVLVISDKFAKRFTTSGLAVDLRALVIIGLLALVAAPLVDLFAKVLFETYATIELFLRSGAGP